jgi:TolA-binding protein
MRYVLLFLVFALALSACTGDSGKELFETAKFEEVQNNREHARELYEEILKKYPKSEYAKKAEERLKELREKQ